MGKLLIDEVKNVTSMYNEVFIQETPYAYWKAKKIIVSDCDGVLTDGSSIVGQYPDQWGEGTIGKFAKTYGSYDNEAIQFMRDMGWKFKFVSADNAGKSITSARVKHLIKEDVTIANAQERKQLVELLYDSGKYDCIVFIGDSLSDLYTLTAEGLDLFCAMPSIRQFNQVADYIMSKYKIPSNRLQRFTIKHGGHGGFAETLYEIHNYVQNFERYKNQ